MRKGWIQKGGRRERFRMRAAAASAALVMLVLTGCGASNDTNGAASSPQFNAGTAYSEVAMESTESADYGYDNGYGESYDDGMYDTATEESAAQSISDEADALSGRKLIRTVNMEVETKEQDYDTFLATLEEEVQNLGGYIESMDRYNGSRFSSYSSSRSTSMTLRIPKDKTDGFLNMVSEAANVVRRSDNVEDVTLSYVDLESHRNSLRTEQERLMELLERAESLEDIITIEDRLSVVRYQLESMESQLRTMDNQVEYSTLYLQVSEVQELTPTVELSVGERIAEGFKDSIKNIAEGAQEIFVWVLVNAPYLFLWILFLAVIILVIKVSWKKSKKSGEKGKQKQEKTEHGQKQDKPQDGQMQEKIQNGQKQDDSKQDDWNPRQNG